MIQVELDTDMKGLGGIRLGARKADVLAMGGFVEEAGDEDTFDLYLKRSRPALTVSLVQNVVIGVSTVDECLINGTNVVGLPLDDAIVLIGGDFTRTLDGEIEIHERSIAALSIELYSRNGLVTLFSLLDTSYIP